MTTLSVTVADLCLELLPQGLPDFFDLPNTPDKRESAS